MSLQGTGRSVQVALCRSIDTCTGINPSSSGTPTPAPGHQHQHRGSRRINPLASRWRLPALPVQRCKCSSLYFWNQFLPMTHPG